MTPKARKSLLRAGLFILSLLVVEVLLRRRGGDPPPPPPRHASERGIELHSDARYLWRCDARENANRSSRPLKILICGEDDAAGSRETVGATWPDYLERALARAIGCDYVAVRSIAVPGFTVAQGERRLETELAAWSPDLVFLHFGSANEFEPPIDGQSDAEWLLECDPDRDHQGLRLVEWITSAVDLPEPKRRSGAATVRVDATAFEHALERMIARTRSYDACPLVVEPVRKAPRSAPDRNDTIAAIYRQSAARIAGVYGVPFVALTNSLSLDRQPFASNSRHLSSRGARVVAMECARTLFTDSSVLLAIQRWLERNASAPEPALVAGTFGLLRTIYKLGPAATPADTVIDVLTRARQQGDADQRTAACLRLAIARHRGDAVDSTIALLEECGKEGVSADRDAALAALLILNGRGTEGNALLTATSGHDGAIAATLRGISKLTTDSNLALEEFSNAVSIDPSLALPDVWRAKSAWIHGDRSAAETYCEIALRTRDCHGGGTRGLYVPSAGSGQIESYLDTDATLFGTEHRTAIPRLLLALAVESVTRRSDASTFLERAFILQAAGRIDEANVALATATERGLGAAADTHLACAWFALESGAREVARAFVARARETDDSDDAKFLAGVIELDSGAPERAIPLFEALLPRRAHDPRLMFYLATARLGVGEPARALEDANKARAVWPDHRELRILIERIEAAIEGS